MIAVRGIISGKVQRVWFRRYVESIAVPLSLRGYARNLPDGCVEVLLCGTADAVAQGQAAVERGSPASRVDSAQWQNVDLDPASIEGFRVL